eukprot:TRINITY_DN39206_c0_g1_i1.p1 TRINITY_DN39206_c0_g1~~TRINITY_DN39206_c0_g1_i1.p1  ORF type:complete len:591 (+),score=83.27 TRINITY_DN39206_c0_g1_i1:107-1774(+)
MAHCPCSAMAHCPPQAADLCKKMSTSTSSSDCKKVDASCYDHILPFEMRLLEAFSVSKISEQSEFQIQVEKIFDQIDLDGQGSIGRAELEALMREKIYPTCPPSVWALSPDGLLEKLGGTDERVTREDFVAAVERMADTLDRRVWPLATSQFLSSAIFALNQPLMPLLVKELGIGMAQFGGMVAVMPMIRVLLALPSTWMANRYGRKPLTVEGQLVAAIGFGMSAFVTYPYQLILCRSVIGIGTSFAGVGQQNMLADIATGRTRSRVYAPGTMRSSAAFTVGPLIGGAMASIAGVQMSYILIGAGMAAVSLRNRHLLTETLRVRSAAYESKGAKTCEDSERTALRGSVNSLTGQLKEWQILSRLFFRDRDLLAAMIASGGFNFSSISAKFVLLPMLALDTWGLGASGFGVALGVMSLTQFAAAKPAAHVADVYGRQFALLPGLALNVVAMVAAASSTAPVELALPLICGAWATGTSLVGNVPSALTLDAAANQKLDQKETASLMALSRVIGDLGMIAGCLTSGVLLTNFSPSEAFGVQAGSLSLVTLATFLVLRR